MGDIRWPEQEWRVEHGELKKLSSHASSNDEPVKAIYFQAIRGNQE